MGDYSKDEIRRIEEKWRSTWEERGVFKTIEDPARPKYYALDMFPYPSGAGLHVGHPLGYIASDIVARYKRIKGFNVLHPMGFDSFGLPAEQYAIRTGQHPALTTSQNIATYKKQLRQIGFSFDWDREVQTSDPSYYKWTQWIFMQLFNAWYNLANGGGKTEPIDTLLREFERHGNANVRAACDDDTPAFKAKEWLSFSPGQKEDILQKYRIAYQSETIVNWCPGLGTVLSNDEVKDGVSERGGYPVERILMLQWSMRISAYAERLLSGLDTIDWPDPLKEIQRNWIGKSVGCELDFQLTSSGDTIRVFTTRIDTIFGVTFMVLAPEHDLVEKITTAAQQKDVAAYVAIAKNRSERERLSEVKRITGVFTGAYVKNPISNTNVPVWIADYVLAGYGTGAVMAVPSSDTRDYAFAKHFNLPIIKVLDGPQSDITKENFDPKTGTMVNSGFLDGLPWNQAIDQALAKVEELGIGTRKINYRMRDAIFGRQRYWGEPFPVYFDDGIPKLVDEKDLPIVLPEIDEYKPTATGEPPLARAKDWKYQGKFPFELTTMPGWAGSSWYWCRYMDPHNDAAFCSPERESYWKEVDLYIGGAEHATGHLLYSRFWNKALKDLGYVHADEPFKKLINQGHIQGVSKFVYRIPVSWHQEQSKPGCGLDDVPPFFISDGIRQKLRQSDRGIQNKIKKQFETISQDYLEKGLATSGEFRAMTEARQPFYLAPEDLTPLNVDIGLVNDLELDIDAFRKWLPHFSNAQFITEDDGKYICGTAVEKMSKSKYNVINPDDIVATHGADTLRMYEMFLGPLEQSKPWNTNGIDGVYKFLRRFWNLFHDASGQFRVGSDEPLREELKVLHKTIRKAERDIENFSFNTTVSEFMICVNELYSLRCNKRAILEPLVIALSPFAPFIAEELWEKLGHPDTILKANFPPYDEQYLKENSFDYPVSINGKVRATMTFALDLPKEDIEKIVLASETVKKWSEGKAVRKVIIVPGKIVNIVL